MARKKKLSGLEKLIVDFIKHQPDKNIKASALPSALKLDKKKDVKRLKKTVDKLVSKKQLTRLKGNLLQVGKGTTATHTAVQGVLSINRFGVGYVTVEGFETDIKIPSGKLGLALPDDIVGVQIIRQDRSGRQIGRVTDIMERGRKFYVGTLIQEGKDNYYIESDKKSAQVDFYILKDNIGKAKHQDKVIFELINWAHPRSLPEARIIETLGKNDTNDARVLSILAENQLRSGFPEEVESFAQQIPLEIPAKEIEKRLDIRDKTIFTIDPIDAKDFDDALSINELDNGNYELGVHIADVSYYLTRDTILDQEALERGTSVYLVDRVIPMLPEILSNGVCSLRPHEDKLTYSCIMQVTPKGQVVDYTIKETIINSKFRFTYENAQEVIDGKNHPYEKDLKLLAKLSSVLTKNRFKNGAINFDTPEPRFELDEKGVPVSIYIKEHLSTHRLVEECMLLANKTVARHIDRIREESGKRKTRDLNPFLYRIHDKPDEQKLQDIANHVRPIGISFDVMDGRMTTGKINTLLAAVEDTNLEYIINQLTLRAMAKAEYSPKNIGHFGLNFSHYTHFTSPIRRYPDVIVHRLLKSYTLNKPLYRYEELKELGTHCSERERMAIDAERDSIKLKQVEYLSNHIGEKFIGVISGVTENGLFVDLKDLHCEGMVHVSNLNDDYYIFDNKRYCLYGRSRGRTYQMGNLIKVKVESANVEQRKVDFLLD